MRHEKKNAAQKEFFGTQAKVSLLYDGTSDTGVLAHIARHKSTNLQSKMCITANSMAESDVQLEQLTKDVREFAKLFVSVFVLL